MFTGCGRQPQLEEPENFYYPGNTFSFGTPDALCTPEERETAGLEPKEILNLYLKGPVLETLQTPFPSGTSVIELEQTDTQVILVLSKEYAALTNLDLVLANACLFQTCQGLFHMDELILSIESGLIDGKHQLAINAADMIFYDHYATLPKS